MPRERSEHPLLAPKALAAVGLGGLGTAVAALPATGGILVEIGLTFTQTLVALITWLYWKEITSWAEPLRNALRLAVPIVMVVLAESVCAGSFLKARSDSIEASNRDKALNPRYAAMNDDLLKREGLSGPQVHSNLEERARHFNRSLDKSYVTQEAPVQGDSALIDNSVPNNDKDQLERSGPPPSPLPLPLPLPQLTSPQPAPLLAVDGGRPTPQPTVPQEPSPIETYSFTSHQQKVLLEQIAAISGSLPSPVFVNRSDTVDTVIVAQQLADIFTRSGIKVQLGFETPLNYKETGFVISLSDTKHPPASAIALQQALQSVGIKASFDQIGSRGPMNGFALFIAPKPV